MVGDSKNKANLAKFGLAGAFTELGNKLGFWVGRLEKVEIKPSQPAGAGARLSLAISY